MSVGDQAGCLICQGSRGAHERHGVPPGTNILAGKNKKQTPKDIVSVQVPVSAMKGRQSFGLAGSDSAGVLWGEAVTCG